MTYNVLSGTISLYTTTMMIVIIVIIYRDLHVSSGEVMVRPVYLRPSNFINSVVKWCNLIKRCRIQKGSD